jgi:hypothetical protein
MRFYSVFCFETRHTFTGINTDETQFTRIAYKMSLILTVPMCPLKFFVSYTVLMSFSALFQGLCNHYECEFIVNLGNRLHAIFQSDITRFPREQAELHVQGNSLPAQLNPSQIVYECNHGSLPISR